MGDLDERNSVWIKKRIVGMTEETHVEVSLQSKTDSVDELLRKAKEALK